MEKAKGDLSEGLPMRPDCMRRTREQDDLCERDTDGRFRTSIEYRVPFNRSCHLPVFLRNPSLGAKRAKKK